MAITIKSELKTEVAEYLDNPQWFSARADNLIAFAEARLNRLLKGRLAKVETSLDGVVSSREIALPADYAEALGLWLTTTGNREPVRAYIPTTLPACETEGAPRGFAVSGSNIVLDRPCDSAHTFDFLYLAKFALATDSDTNWLLTNWSDAYFRALMTEAFLFKRDLEAAATWKGLLEETIDEINLLDSRADTLAPLGFDRALTTGYRNGRVGAYQEAVLGGDYLVVE